MTGFEAEAIGGLGDKRESGSGWYRLLVPFLTAAIVLALGLVLVGLTTDEAETHQDSPPAEVSAPLR
jgi:hypothetical protein